MISLNLIFAFQFLSFTGQSPREGPIRAGLPAAEPSGGGLFRTGVPGGTVRHQVLAGSGETTEPAGRSFPNRTDAAVLRQILHSGSAPAGGGIHPVPVLFANQAGFGHRELTVQ